LVSHDPAASEEHIIRALNANQFQVQQAPGGLPPKLDDFQLVVINNWDMESIPAAAKTSLEEYVKKGAAWSGSPASTIFTSIRRASRKMRWNAPCPRNSLRRVPRKAPPWCSSSINRRPWKAARSSWRASPPSVS
jgi:hypothetical protein